MKNQAALDAFMTAKAQIDAIIAQLSDASDEHFGTHPDAIHWGHVGDLNRAIERLRDAADCICARPIDKI